MGKAKPLARGDLLKINWVDIYEDSVGNPDRAKPAERTTYGLFWAQEVRGPVECLVTTTTIDSGGHEQAGYCIYPIGTIVKIEVVKRNKVN